MENLPKQENSPKSENKENLELQQEQPQNFVLDPLITLSKLALLHFYPDNTKLCFCYNTFYLQEDTYIQIFLRRYYYKANREDLIKLYVPIRLAISFYLHNQNKQVNGHVTNIMLYAIKGLKKLQQTYKNDKMVVLMLQHYVDLLDNATLNSIKEYKNLDIIFDNQVTEELCKKELWDKSALKDVSERLDTFSTKDVNTRDFKTAKDEIECYIKMKEERYQKYLVEM